MLLENEEKLIKIININKADEKINNNIYWFNWKQHTFDNGSKYGFYIITNENNTPVGMFHFYENDISIVTLEKYRNKHYMSNFLKSNIWRNKLPNTIKSITMVTKNIESILDYNKKVHLIKDIIKLPLRNYDQVITYILMEFSSEEVYKKRFDIDFYKKLNITYRNIPYFEELENCILDKE